MKTAQDILRQEYGNSTNFMTPHVLSVGRVGNIAYEISKGKGISGQDIFGVSLVTYDPDTDTTSRNYEGSGCYDSLEEAREVIDNL